VSWPRTPTVGQVAERSPRRNDGFNIFENASPVDPAPSRGPAGRRVPEAFYNRDRRTALRWFRIRRLAGVARHAQE
jgi:hypothetical protein